MDVPYCDVYDQQGREILPNGLHRRIIGYFASWRTGGNDTPKFLVNDIPWSKLSEINYAFAQIGADGTVDIGASCPGNAATDATWPNDPGATMDPSLPYTGHMNLMHKFKGQHPGVKVIVSIGGWSQTGGYNKCDGSRVDSGGFYTMTQTQAGIDKFADSVVAFLRKYGLDGADIDYEYATSNSKAGNPDDFWYADTHRGDLWPGYVSLMKTLRQKLDKASAADGKYYMLTAAVPASGWLLRGQEVYQVTKYLDYVNLMSYDLHGAWNEYVAGLAALYDDGNDPELKAGGVYNAYDGMGYLNVDWAYHYFRGAMPAGRINIGVPYYTRGWVGVTGGTHGLYGTAPLPDQNDCPKGTGGKIGSKTPCGNGATGIDNLWHDLDDNGDEVPSGVNPIWHVLNLENGVRGSYASAYGVPDSSALVGTYTHHFDSLTKAEWWWNNTTKTFLTGDSNQAIQAKADYVVDKGIGGIMIWELAGDYAYDAAKGEYGMGDTLTTEIYNRFTQAGPYGATKAKQGETLPTQAIDLDVQYSGFKLGDNNYPITPTVTFVNNSSVDIPGGSTITFDYATSNTKISDQSGLGLHDIARDQTGPNVGGIKGPFNTAQLTLPSWGKGIPAGGSFAAKFSWSMPMAQLSNVRVTINGTTYATTYDLARGVTVVDPGDGNGGGDNPDPTPTPEPGQCTGTQWDAGSVYNGGEKVWYDAHYWSARWWTQGDAPSTANSWGPWKDDGPC